MSGRSQRRKKKGSPKKAVSPGNVNDDGTQVERSAKPSLKTKKKKKRVNKHYTPQEPPFKENVQTFIRSSVELGVPGLLAEFEEIKKQTQEIGVTPKAAFDANPDKNRYKDVYCIDETRVKLKGCDKDYIHANCVTFPNKDRYICTQAPLPATIDDFWRMVWHERCKAIVMLCSLVEGGEKKCEQYWPESGEMKYGKLTVKVAEKVEFEKVMTITKLMVYTEGGPYPHEIEHIRWHDWPDRGVPVDVVAWMKLAQRLKGQFRTTLLVHCSDGIGRTGTFVGLNLIVSTLGHEEYAKRSKEIVLDLREQRHGSVQTAIQYLYMHRALIAFGLSRMAVTEEEVKSFIYVYDTLCKQSGYQ